MTAAPEEFPASALRCIHDALEHAEQECPYHGSDWERPGFSRGEPRCDSCKQPWRVSRALRAVKILERVE